MNKTCIITITQGDFDYIEEWIEYHHNIGIDLFIIGYNGHPDNFNKLPKYDYVRYIDFSTDYNLNSNGKYFYFKSKYENFCPLQDHLLTILLQMCVKLFYDYSFCAAIDVDEFLYILNPAYTNINDYLSDTLTNDNWLVKNIYMRMGCDNNLIYNDNRPCLERFPNLKDINNVFWETKQIFNLKHNNIESVKFKTAHQCNYSVGLSNSSTFNPKDITLNHYRYKTLEEHISQLLPTNNLWRNTFYKTYFSDFFSVNEMTEEKIKAIPELLKKYNIKYDVNVETNKNFIDMYLKYNNSDNTK